MDESDKIRRAIERRIAQLDAAGDGSRVNLTQLSEALGRAKSYMHDYLHKQSPKNLSYEARMTLAAKLDMDPRELGIAPTSPIAPPSNDNEDDVEPYHAPKGHYLEAVALDERFVVKTAVMDQHPDRLQPGDVLILDLKARSPAALKSMDVVIAEARNRRDLTAPPRLVLRMFLAPNKLATNSSAANEICSIDDTSHPFEYEIKGRLQTIMRNTRQNSRHA